MAHRGSDRPQRPPARNAVADTSSSDSANLRHWAEEVGRHLAALPEQQALALRLTYSHALPPHEVAAWLGVTQDEVPRLVAVALIQLGDLLRARI
jgi:DNA-directed RNA polymerase specialized sigma24 family protein